MSIVPCVGQTTINAKIAESGESNRPFAPAALSPALSARRPSFRRQQRSPPYPENSCGTMPLSVFTAQAIEPVAGLHQIDHGSIRQRGRRRVGLRLEIENIRV